MNKQPISPQNIFTEGQPSLPPPYLQVPAIQDIGEWLQRADQWAKHSQVHAIARDKAWEVLQHREINIPDFTTVANCPMQLFRERVPASLHQPVADALHILGWHVYNNPRRPSPDQALYCLELAHTLTPKDPTVVERFSDIARTISEDDIPRVRSESRGHRVAGFRLSAQRMVLDTLESQFGILEGAIRNTTAPHVPQLFGKLSLAERDNALLLLESLSAISLKLGLSGKHLKHLQLAEDAACTHLACLGYPRSPSILVSDIFIGLKKTTNQRQVDTIRRGLHPGTENILEHLAHIQDVKLDKIPYLLNRTISDEERASLERKLAQAHNVADGIHFIFGMLYPSKDPRGL